MIIAESLCCDIIGILDHVLLILSYHIVLFHEGPCDSHPYWRASLSKWFIGMGVRATGWQLLRPYTADYLRKRKDGGCLEAGGDNLLWEREMLKMSLITSACWLVPVFSTQPGILSGPATLFSFSLNRIFLTPAVVTYNGQSSGSGVEFRADSFSRRSKHNMCSAYPTTWPHTW